MQVRIGVHTGIVVIGEVGNSEKREILALGETPNLAARLQGLAEPDTVVMSAATQRLVPGLFECLDLGPHELKGFSTPLSIYRVIRESGTPSRFEAAVHKGLTPLVGRELEVRLLRERWLQAKGGAGQVVLLSGEPGIGKSRLVQELKEHVTAEGAACIEFRCSPYHQNSTLYPIIEHLQRLLQFTREDAPTIKLEKLQCTLARYRFPQGDTVPLLAALLSLPQPERYPPIMVSPQKQKEKTQAALVAWLVEEAEQQPVYTTWEDLHWADPSTLEVLTLLLDQAPTTRLLALLTSRPEFSPLWGLRSYLTQLTLNRLGQPQVEAMVERIVGDEALPPEVVQQIVSKTDGVPLFVEELTKTVIESVRAQHAAPTPLAIPATLQDSLMARLDRLGQAKEIAQLGAVLGREFSYELLHAVASRDDGSLQHGLRQIVQAELLYQRGLPPQAVYFFKHALVQDTAYQSLLKSRRQQLHQQIARVLESRFTEITETQPELLAHHYTEAGLIAQAIPYWQKAGQRAAQRSAYVEAIGHLTKGLELLQTLPDTRERAQHELALQVALGTPLIVTKGYTALEVATAYTRARELCQQIGETSQLVPVLLGLHAFYLVRAEYKTARELAEQLLRLARDVQDTALLLEAHRTLGTTLFSLGELTLTREHLEQALTFYEAQSEPSTLPTDSLQDLQDPGTVCLSYVAWVLWLLGYPDQALKRSHEALTLARELAHPFSLAIVLGWTAIIHDLRREGRAAQAQAEAAIAACIEQEYALYIGIGTLTRGWALAEQGQLEEGIAQMRHGLAAWGAETGQTFWPALLAAACGRAKQTEEGLSILAEALAVTDKTGERFYEAELYRLKGELLLAQAKKQATGNGQ